MPYGWVAAASLVGGALSSNASQQAAGQQAGAANNATAAQLAMFNTQNLQQGPYRQTGYSGLGQLAGYLGLPGYSADQGPSTTWDYKGQSFNSQQDITNALVADYKSKFNGQEPTQQVMDQISADVALAKPVNTGGQNMGPGGTPLTGTLLHQFNADDLQTNLAPNYQFMLNQGLGATQHALNATGGNISGNTLKGINDYAQNYAGNAYQTAFQNYTSNQTNIFNRLADIAGLGQTANQTSAGLAGSMAPGIANTIQGAGAAQAAGTVGSANAITGGINNAASWYGISNMMNQNQNQNTNLMAG